MYKEGKRRAHELLPSHLTPCVICFYSIAHHVLPVFVLFCNYILLPLMRFQTSNKVVVSVFLIGTLFPALFSRLSVQYVLLF